MYDTDLQAKCFVVETTSGYRCVVVGDYAGTFFADASCTVPLVRPDANSPSNTAYTQDECGVIRTFDRGAPFAGTVYEVNGTCMPATPTATQYSLGAEIDVATYIPGTFTDAGGSGRLIRHGWLGTDGAFQSWEFRDSARGGETCGVSTGAVYGGTRCVANNVLLANSSYGDNACMVPIAPTVGPSCAKRDYIYSIDTRGITFHPVDTAAAAPTQQFTWSFSCAAATLDSSVDYAVAGPAISFDVFALATERVE